MCAALLLASPISSPAAGESQKTLVDVQDVAVEKVNGNIFSVTVSGIVRTAGWIVNLHPTIYDAPPEIWVIQAVGIEPTGFVAQVITPWTRSIELNLPKETQQVSVEGGNQTIAKPSLGSKNAGRITPHARKRARSEGGRRSGCPGKNSPPQDARSASGSDHQGPQSQSEDFQDPGPPSGSQRRGLTPPPE